MTREVGEDIWRGRGEMKGKCRGSYIATDAFIIYGGREMEGKWINA